MAGKRKGNRDRKLSKKAKEAAGIDPDQEEKADSNSEDEVFGEEEDLGQKTHFNRSTGSRPKTPSKRSGMPASTGVRRVRGCRIERPFWIGSEAWPLDSTNRKPDTPAEHTKGWRVYVRTAEGQPNINVWLRKVSFKIYHTYPNPTRIVENPPFQIEETGWGGFQVEVRLFFPNEAQYKPEPRSHFLQLEPYGDEAMQQRQKDEKMVRSEIMDVIEFNEPTETFYNLMTDEELNFGPKQQTKGKGKARQGAAESNGNGTVELPETGGPDNPYTKENERKIVESFAEAEKQLDSKIEQAKKDMELVLQKLADVRARRQQTDADLARLERGE